MNNFQKYSEEQKHPPDFNLYEYMKYILRNNVFTEIDILYYRGELKKSPQNIPHELWKEVTKDIGFSIENMDIFPDGKFTMKGDD